jgi:magnesium transporter
LDRLLALPGSHSADWIAHGLLDSIVDAFFPLIRYVDGEVDDIDSLTIDPTIDPKAQTHSASSSIQSSPTSSVTAVQENIEMSEKLNLDEKVGTIRKWQLPDVHRPRPRRHIPWLWLVRLRPSRNHNTASPVEIKSKPIMPLPKPLTYLRLFFLPTTSARPREHEAQSEQVFDRSTMLKRITDMRRLVTGLTRLLGAKHQVIGRLRKRAKEEGGGVEAYIGDVEGE